MQRIYGVITAGLIASAMLLPEDSELFSVMKKTGIHMRNVARTSQRQTEGLFSELDESLEAIEEISRHAYNTVIKR